MSMPIALLFHQIRSFESEEAIAEYSDIFFSLGYNISDVRVRLLLEQHFGKSINEALAEAYQHRNINFRVEHTQNDLSLGVYGSWNAEQLEGSSSLWIACNQTVLVREGYDEKPEYDAVYYWRHLLDLGKSLYQVTFPSFGWIEHTEPGMSPSDEEIAAGKVFAAIEGVYWANFFSPELVARSGRDRLETPPHGWSEELPDGGMVYVLAASPDWNTQNARQRQEMRQYFDL